VPARLADNPRIGPEYRAKLMQLDPVRRAQLLDGDWLKKAAPKDLWDRAEVRHLEHAPARSEVRARVRCWDFAASEADDADWTVGLRASITHAGLVVLEHMVRLRGVPSKVRAAFSRAALADRDLDPRTVQWIPLDPGQAGADQVLSYQTANPGIAIRSRRPSGDKLTRFGPASARALDGGLAVVLGPWNDALHDELEEKPEGAHDDVMDTVSDCVAVLTGAVSAEFTDELARAASHSAPVRPGERDAYAAFMHGPDDDDDAPLYDR
jgi:predicted phage terminase large subunit-like protein